MEAIVAGGGEADEVLRRVVAELHERAGYAWAGIFFVESGTLVLGPEAGTPDEAARVQVPVTWQGERVAELAVDGNGEEPLDWVAELISPYCLVGWDTGGLAWEP